MIMSKTSPQKKKSLTHPRSGNSFRIEADIYAAFKAAILQSLARGKEKTFTELSDDVIKIIRKKMPGFKGSVPWYTITVKLDLESKGLVESLTAKGKKLIRRAAV